MGRLRKLFANTNIFKGYLAQLNYRASRWGHSKATMPKTEKIKYLISVEIVTIQER